MTHDEFTVRQREITALIASSRADLDRALLAAWTLGRMLQDERVRVRRTMGRSAWQQWLDVTFPVRPALASLYLRFAREISSPTEIPALSLRQAYFRLGVSTEPKLRDSTRQRRRLAGYIRNAQRLVTELRRRRRRRSPAEIERVRVDLGPLFRELALLFRQSPPAPTSTTTSLSITQRER
jgi:hypothetical protein